jgi:hypothetical protein
MYVHEELAAETKLPSKYHWYENVDVPPETVVVKV